MLNFDLYEPGASWLHRVDPRIKLLFAIEATAALLVLPGLPLNLVILGACHVLLVSARIPWRRVGGIWRLLLPLTLLVVLLWLPLLPQGAPVLLAVWRIRVTLPALRSGLEMATRLDAVAFVFYVWLLTTEQRALVQGLVRLGLPYEWGLTFSLSLRYLPTLHATYLQIVDAQRARGLDLREGTLFARARRRLPILIALLVTALRSSENVGRALEARALGTSGTRRSSLHELQLRRADLLMLVALPLLPFVGLALARLL
jgi:energy-coupling factor transport system permease protein